MNQDLNELISAKRKRRAASKAMGAKGQDEEQPETEVEPTRALFDKAVNQFENRAFVHDAGDDVEQIDDSSEQQQAVDRSGRTKAQKEIVAKHRDKSRELAKTIKEDDPNKVSDRLKGVQDRVRDKIKPLLKEQLEKARQESEDTMRSDLKLDLSASGTDFNMTQTRLSASEKAREMAEQRLRKIKENTYRIMGTTRRETTRFDDDDESDVDKKIAKIKSKRIKDKNIATEEEAFDFFGKQAWDEEEKEEVFDEDESKKTKLNEDETIQKDTEEDERKEEIDEAKKEEEPLILKMEDDWRDINYIKAVYLPHDLAKELDGKNLFLPKTTNVPLSQKLGEEVKFPRFLEDEGFYVGRKPYVTTKNRNLMENRLIVQSKDKENKSKWFGVDGEILALPDPIKYVSTRPSFNPTYSHALYAEYRKALYLDDFSQNIIADKGSRNTVNVARFRIDLDINQLQFTFHHLFSSEHMIAFNLKAMCDHFKLTEEQNLIEILSEKLKVLKIAMKNFQQELAAKEHAIAAQQNAYVESNDTILRFNSDRDRANLIAPVDLNRLQAYKNEIKLTREEREIQMKQKKTLTEKILATWKELKEIRELQRFRNTEFRLIIKKKKANEEKEKREFEREVREVFDETIKELKEEHRKNVEEYTRQYKLWKLQQTRKTEASRRQEEREKNRDKINTDITMVIKEKEAEEKDLKILCEDDLSKPIKPNDVNEDEVYRSIRTRYEDIYKTPGHPILSFDLIEESGSITASNECSTVEQIRRNRMARTKVFIRIFLNEKLVNTTVESQLQNDFSVKWAQIFNIFMVSHPDSIVLQIVECQENRSKERLISEVIVPTPPINSTSKNYSLEDIEFSSNEAFAMHLKTTNQIQLFYTSGAVRTGAAWGIDNKTGAVLAPTNPSSDADTAIKNEEMKNYDAIMALGVSHMQDIEKLAKWIVKSNLDPNDPKNADLINLIKTLNDSSENEATIGASFKLPSHFRLDQMMQEFNFATDEEIEKNVRYRLIMLRDQGEPEFRGFKMIPAFEGYIRKDQFVLYEKRRVKDLVGEEDEDQINETFKSTRTKQFPNPIDLARARGYKIIREIRERIIKQFRFAQNQKTLADLIVEEQVPNINALGNLFWSLYVEPKRPLYPVRRERKKVKGQNISPDDVYLMVNVVNAYDLPVREDKLKDDPMKTMKDPITGREIKVHENIAGHYLVRPFVEVTFQETVYRTSSADGPNASWNQEILLPFKAPNNDLRPESLQTCKDNIYINVFDEVEIDVLEDDRERDSTVHKKKLRYWLGSLKIPFSTVYFKSKIEGTFKLETPPVMIGYKKESKMSYIQSFGVGEAGMNMGKAFKESSYLSLFITIEPQLLVPDAYRESYDSIESFELLDKVINWVNTFKKKYPTREFRPIVMNTDGKSVLLTRYLRPIRPPESIIEKGEESFETAISVARFVSLIPFVSDSLVFPGICDIWSTCDQFLEMLAGDEEEHSVLMVNLFLGLKKRAWLLVGSSITNGLCSYPLTIEQNEYTIWYQGEPYKVTEPHNPVKVVSALVSPDEMWFNIQQFDEPFRISFDLSNPKHWKPFFGKHRDVAGFKFDSVQPEKLIYKDTAEQDVIDLEKKIKLEIEAKLREWRAFRMLRQSSKYVTNTLRDILQNMEKFNNWRVTNQSKADELIKKSLAELINLRSTSRVCGFPINLPYTNMSSILEAVYATQAHAIPTSDVEYAISVYVHPYPNNILSVWIYIALITKQESNNRITF